MADELNINELEGILGGKGGSKTKLPPKGGCIVYQIQSGDKLGVIARRYNTTVEAIQAANPGLIPNKNDITAGYYIYIPV